MLADGDPFGSADNANVLEVEDGEKEVPVGPVGPVLVHLGQ